MANGVTVGESGDQPLSVGAAHELTLVVADALATMEARHGVRSSDEQAADARIALLAAPTLIPELRALIASHSYSGVVSTCGEGWLCAAVLVLKAKTLLHARRDWLLAGMPPSPALFRAAMTLCDRVPALGHLRSDVQQLDTNRR